jgi:hypothetical protein
VSWTALVILDLKEEVGAGCNFITIQRKYKMSDILRMDF